MNTERTTIHASLIVPGMTVATIPSIASGRATSDQGVVLSVEEYSISGETFYDVRVRDELGAMRLTNMTGVYELVSL